MAQALCTSFFSCQTMSTYCNARSITYAGGAFLLIIFSAVATTIACADFPIPLGAKIAIGCSGLTLAALSTKIAKVCSGRLPFAATKTESNFQQLIDTITESQKRQQALIEQLLASLPKPSSS